MKITKKGKAKKGPAIKPPKKGKGKVVIAPPAKQPKEKKIPFPKNSPVIRAPNVRKGEGRLDFPGYFVVNFLAKENPHIAKVRDSLRALSRDELAARLALIYCEILGLTGMERQ